MKLHSRKLKTLEDINLFKSHFDELSGNPVPIEYLSHSIVRAFIQNETGRMIGGYVVNPHLKKRYLQWVPKDSHVPFLDHVDESEIVEITCIWSKIGKMSHSQKMNMYLLACWDAFWTGNKYIIGGSFFRKIMLIQTKCISTIFYSGPGLFAGEKTKPCWIYYVKRHKVFFNILKTVIELTIENRQRSRRAKENGRRVASEK